MDDFAVESRYEYDAPRFVDFELLRQGELDDDDVDQWFGKHIKATIWNFEYVCLLL